MYDQLCKVYCSSISYKALVPLPQNTSFYCYLNFFQDKTVLCPSHTYSAGGQGGTPPHNDPLKTLAVYRKVYVQRKETKQIASIMQQGELMQGEKLLTWLTEKMLVLEASGRQFNFYSGYDFFTRHFLCFVALADNWTALWQRY